MRKWTAGRVRELRKSLDLTQERFAQHLGVRQQTISEWETGVYVPRGASARVLDLVAEKVEFQYGLEAPEATPDAGD
ncbi:MAG: helix-turn-helix domain-containing protein [Chloroflexi bacterium]|nr:helix-turn-helix domain-containing protein [Chloroflexota bacterium]